MVGWHNQLNGHESEKTLGDSEGQGSLACCRPWGRPWGPWGLTEKQLKSNHSALALPDVSLLVFKAGC